MGLWRQVRESEEIFLMKRDLFISKEMKENLRQLRKRREDGFSSRRMDNQAKFKNKVAVHLRRNSVGQKDCVVTPHYMAQQ